MRKLAYCFLCIPALLLVGCYSVRPISSSGYYSPSAWGPRTMYEGELSEFDILGTATAKDVTQAKLENDFRTQASPQIQRGDKLLLIQSGAMVPDNEMLDAANAIFSVAPFSGMPPKEKTGMADSLRLIAAKGGYHYILCYWGVLESAQEDREGKIVSWIPIAGSFVPDQKEQMRIRLKAIVLDVTTGNWKMLTPEVHSDSRFNSNNSREWEDQSLVHALKAKGYKTLVDDLVR